MIEKILKVIFLIIAIALFIKIYENSKQKPEKEFKYAKEKKVKEDIIKEPEISAKELLKQAADYYNNKQFVEAKNKLNVLIAEHPASNKADNVVNLMAKIEKEFQRQEDEIEAKQKKEIEEKLKKAALASEKMMKKHDESNELTWYRDKSSPVYINKNGIFLYFQKIEAKDHVSNLRFKIQYHADDFIGIKGYQFDIDGKTFSYTPPEVRKDSGEDGKVWEWSDEQVNKDTFKIIEAIIKSKSAKIRINGSEDYKITKIEPIEKSALKNVLDAYKAMGGSLSF
jgi:hypothetical protein